MSPEELVTIVDAAVKDAVLRSGGWLACRPGCSQCCHGVFAIAMADAARLREGLSELTRVDPERAARVRRRAADAVHRLAPDFPGDAGTGVLDNSLAGEERFAEFGDEEPCPALDPATQTCDLYGSRPILCRTFGPPLRLPEGLAVCELCFVNAPDEEVDRCQVDPGLPARERDANLRFDREASGASPAKNASPGATTIIAFALRGRDSDCFEGKP